MAEALPGANQPASQGRNPSGMVKMLAFERRALGMFDHVAAVSAEDARIMESCFGARSVEVIPNGVDLRLLRSGRRRQRTETIVYCGSMDYFPNQDAALHFARKILPRIRGRRAQARFLVLGRSPPASIWALANDHIAVSGTVDDVRPYLSSATVSVVPLRVAGGLRLKILESFAAGVPVVSTSIGAEGLGLRHGAELLIADDEAAFAAECVRLLEQPRLREQMARTAETHLNHNCDWRAIAPLVEAAWERTRCNFTFPAKNRSAAVNVLTRSTESVPVLRRARAADAGPGRGVSAAD